MTFFFFWECYIGFHFDRCKSQRPRPKSKGRLYLTSADPKVKPALDFRYFTDPDDYDAKCLVAGIRQARLIAKQKPLKDWLIEEIAPGPLLQSDSELNNYARRVAHTVYHPAVRIPLRLPHGCWVRLLIPSLTQFQGTCKMGSREDAMAVVDPSLKIRGLSNIRIVDASIFPVSFLGSHICVLSG